MASRTPPRHAQRKYKQSPVCTLPNTPIPILDKPSLHSYDAAKGAALLQRHPPHNYLVSGLLHSICILTN